MGVQYSAAQLTDMIDGMTLEQAQEIMDEALSEGKIHTKSGRIISEPMQYYALRLFATGSESHQFAGVRAGDSDEEDQELRRAAWVLYRNAEPPESAKRQSNTNGENRKSSAGRGSQSNTIRITAGANVDETMEKARQVVEQWFEDLESKKKDDAERTIKSTFQKLASSGVTAEMLADQLGIPVEAARLILKPKVQEATVEENDEEENDEENDEEDEGQEENPDYDGGDNEETEQPARGRNKGK